VEEGEAPLPEFNYLITGEKRKGRTKVEGVKGVRGREYLFHVKAEFQRKKRGEVSTSPLLIARKID